MENYINLFNSISPTCINLFLVGLFFLIATIVLFNYQANKKFYYGAMGLSIVFISSGFALIDPYLNSWDEQYHALVAKNLVNNPSVPVLIKNSTSVLDYRNWTNNHVWLHKQPLFLYQIALSIKIFGANVFAVRFPSIILHALTTVLCFSIAKRFLLNNFALLAALLFGVSDYYNDYVSGAIGMDHNDVAFMFYVVASFWAWLKYQDSKSKKWVYLIGVLSGGAILTKWLVGLVVFSGWGISIIIFERKNLVDWLNLFTAFFISILIALPWQIYCATYFPKEYFYELSNNSKHFISVVENHGGSVLFYWENMKYVFGKGDAIRWIIVVGFILFLVKAFQKNKAFVFGATCFLVTYLFFSIAQTKLQGYVTIVSIFGFIMLLIPFQYLFNLFETKFPIKWSLKIPRIMLILVIIVIHFSPKSILDRHKFNDLEFRNQKISFINTTLKDIENLNPRIAVYCVKTNKDLLPNILFFNKTKTRIILN